MSATGATTAPGPVECLLGASAACSACLFTNPLEVIKIRMQLQGELMARGKYTKHYRNVFQAFYAVGRYDGLSALQKGLVPGLWYQFFMNGPRLGLFQTFDNLGFLRTKSQGSTRGQVIFHRSVIAAAVSGVVGAVIGSPFYMIKTQLQAQSTGSIAVGYQHSHSSMVDSRIMQMFWFN
jgi:solute carrier family 25 protein 34/35